MLMALLLRRKIKFGQFPNFQTNCEGIYNPERANLATCVYVEAYALTPLGLLFL